MAGGRRCTSTSSTGRDIGPGTTVLDCGCGAGRFVGLATQRGAVVAGIDASGELAEIAATRAPGADIRVGDFEALPWPDKTFDVVTGFSTFQFADDHVAALAEARRVSRGRVWVVIPTRLADSGIPELFAALAKLFPPELLPSLKRSGMYALSAPGTLEETLVQSQDEAPVRRDDRGNHSLPRHRHCDRRIPQCRGDHARNPPLRPTRRRNGPARRVCPIHRRPRSSDVARMVPRRSNRLTLHQQAQDPDPTRRVRPARGAELRTSSIRQKKRACALRSDARQVLTTLVKRLYAAKRGSRPRIGVAGEVCQSTPQCRSSRSR